MQPAMRRQLTAEINCSISWPSMSTTAWNPSCSGSQLTLKEVVHPFDADVAHVHFPTTALVSLLTVLEEDDPIEVTAIGHNGMVGVAVALGVMRSPHRVICQMAGETLRLPVARFLAALAPGA